MQRFFTDKQHRVRKLSGNGNKPKITAIINPSSALRKLPKPSWKRRPVYIKEGEIVSLALLDSMMGIVDPVPVAKAGVDKRSYDTDSKKENKPHGFVSYNGCPDLHVTKAMQRKDVAAKMNGGTSLELFAGKGNLSKEVWSKKASKLILVDKNADSLKSADKKLKGKNHECVTSNNMKWLEGVLPQEKIVNLKVVDIDAFGSPVPVMRTFFDNYPVKKSMFVTLTDGSALYAKIGNHKQTRAFFMKNYGVNPSGSRADQIKALDKVMMDIGRKKGFRVEPINAGFGKQAVYAGYKIVPRAE